MTEHIYEFDAYLDLLAAVVDTATDELSDLEGGGNPLGIALCRCLVAAAAGYCAYAGEEHPQVSVVLRDGTRAEVDEEIAPLILFLNNQPGIRTIQSCQGGKPPYLEALRSALEAALQAVEAEGRYEGKEPYIWMECQTPAARRWLGLHFNLASEQPLEPGTVTIRGEQISAWRAPDGAGQ